MLLIVNLHNEMTPLEVEGLRHRILAEAGVMSVQWQEAAQQSVQSDGFTAEQISQIRRIARDVAFEGGD